MRIIWSPQAEREVDEIWHFIAADDPDAADRLAEKFRSTSLLIGDHPKLGRAGRSRGSRELVVAGTPYLVLYRIGQDAVEVLHVIHGARDWPPRRRRP